MLRFHSRMQEDKLSTSIDLVDCACHGYNIDSDKYGVQYSILCDVCVRKLKS